MKKRLLALLLAAVLIVILSACGGEAAPEDASATDLPEDTDAPSGDAPAESTDPAASADPAASPTIMTVSESVRFLEGLSPALLGLEGVSMANYNVYPAEEAVKVDGLTCAKLSVYKTSPPSETNIIQGVYLLSRDASRLFKLNADTKTVEEIKIA